MAHFAKLDENNIVTQVIVVSNDDIKDENGVEREDIGINFCKRLQGNDTNWKQTSYNNNFRVRYAGVGYFYDENLDAFIPPKPYNSWVFNEETSNWNPPVPMPDNTQEGLYYVWDEESLSWILETLSP